MNEHLVSETATRWCSAPGCMMNIKIAKRHYFRFPKERRRWMEWIKACNRMDLVMIGPEYANRYYRLCHLHFRVEMFRNIEGRIYLNKEAVPTIFLKPLPVGNSDTSANLIQPISFVTIFLKPESKNSLFKDVSVRKELEISETSTSNEKDTPIISSLQALFPKASIKHLYDKRNISTTQATLIEVKSESNNESTSSSSAVEMRAITDMCTDSVTSIASSWPVPKENCNGLVTSMGSSSSTTLLGATSVLAMAESNIRTTTRTRWHVSTQTPSIDFLVGKRRIEEPEIHIDTPAAKRKKGVSHMEIEDYRIDVSRFKAACMDLLPRNAALLVFACVDARERSKAMRHNFEGKQFALELFLMAPGAYRFYRPLCLLPTVRQLWRHVRDWDMPTGISDNVLNALHLKMKSLPSVERHCCLCVNEMRLRPHLFYNLSRDRIIGFDSTDMKKRTLAKKALVIIARSLAGDWEQPIAYYFQEDICIGNVMKNLIFLAISKLRSIGVIVHVLVTGTAPIFLRLSRLLGIFVEHPSFLVDGERVFYIFDVGRLMRATRNILMKYELHFREKRASWMDIELFFRSDSQMQLPLVSKLSVAHLEPNKYQKTETKYAVQVFSSTLAAGLSAYTVSGGFPLKAIGTVEFLRNFDQLFDILNSSTPTKSNGKDFSQAFTGNAHEMCFLQRILDFLKSIRVVDKNSACVKPTGCFSRWQITINAVMQLWSVLREHQLPFLRTRQLNQECVERIFRSIRRQSGNRALPTPIMFTRAFKNLVSKHLLEHSCGEDSAGKVRRMLKRIAASSASTLSSSSRTNQQAPTPTVQIALHVTTTNYRDIDPQLPEKVAFKRVCEYLLDECWRMHNCDVCVAYVREAKESPEGTPNSFRTYVSGLEDVFMSNFEDFAAEENLGMRLLQLAQQVKYQPPCPEFPVAPLLQLYLRMRIYITLSRYNKIYKTGAESCATLSMLQL